MRHASVMRRLAVAALCVLGAACANASGPGGSPENDVPTVAGIVCKADGSTRVRTPQVLVQPDGIHVRVVSHLDEPASVGELGRDVEPGETTFVSTRPPGEIDAACYPYSQHDDGTEPLKVPFQALDPDGSYVDGEIQCTGMMSGMIGDFFERPLEGVRVPIEAARAKIRGLDDDDQVVHVGYPEQPAPQVAVRRDGQVVATYSFVTFDGEGWVIGGSSICESSGLR
jgi:hypothetical protein